MISLRAFVAMLLLGGLAVAVMPATPAPAQETNTGPSTGDQPPPPAFDPTARIKYLHDRLRITAEQEPLWDTVAQAIRDNARETAPLLKERFRATTSGNTPDILHAYEALGEVQLDNFKKFIAAFEPLYASLPDNQKRIADAVLRESAQKAMIGGLPVVPGPLAYPLGYSPLSIGPGIPLFGYRLGGFHRFHGFAAPGPHFGRFHH
jgi:protein CpxP